ncbi:hypothetical protein Pint_20742 [Pistacia integerrima]|uniref:Uncharacterized protein n=1 Tax=Pistacia integerrima TaxID=434235 RepID=A0ACC0XBS7_9ROSI|nr:hypothetical protein Pint_20742 [Pistacia integerrima]
MGDMGENSQVLTQNLGLQRTPLNNSNERRAKGLCYNCNERFIPSHRCKKLFLIEGCDIGEGEEVVSDTAANVVKEIDGVLEISLHAICGAKAPKTMRDFANLIMKYEVVGKEVELKGVTARMDTVISDPTCEAR